MDDQNKSRFSNVNTGDFKVKPSKGSHSWGLRNIPRQKVLNSIRSDDSLHIVCQIECVPDFNKLPTTVIRRDTSTNHSQVRLNLTYACERERFLSSSACARLS